MSILVFAFFHGMAFFHNAGRPVYLVAIRSRYNEYPSLQQLTTTGKLQG
jgi:hypothetical protein